MEQTGFYHDRLYGRIYHTTEEEKIFQTSEFSRLNNVSLSAIPTWVLKCGVCASKAEHSIGTAHLARIIGEREEFADQRLNIYFANLLHDIGTPPMSHMSERFLEKLFGYNHEQFSKMFLFDTRLGDEVERQGGDLEVIYRLITGDKTHPFSSLVNSPSIDPDNLDNSLRYALSKGLIQWPLYNPTVIARAFRYDASSQEVYLESSCLAELPGWESARVHTYAFVYSEHNMAPGSMLNRALALATDQGKNEIPLEYFSLTDYEAYQWLESKCNLGTRQLALEARHQRYHKLVFSEVTNEPTEAQKWLSADPYRRNWLADLVADYFGIPKHYICAHIGRDKGFKKIHLAIRNSTGSVEIAPQSILKEKLYTQIFISPDSEFSDAQEKIRKLMEEVLTSYPPLEVAV